MLVRLYSETGLLKNNVRFKPGINIVLGKYAKDKETNNINGIGKSSLIRLIDYAFLSNKAGKVFAHHRYDFLREESHNIVLEFRVNDQNYFIKRSFGNKENVFFGSSPAELDEFSKTELKTILLDKLFPVKNREVFFEGKRFRSLMNFFIKDDLQNQKRLDPFSFVYSNMNKREALIYNFYLLNFPTKNLLTFDNHVKSHDEKSKAIKTLEEKLSADTDGKSLEEFRSERIKIEDNIRRLEKSLGDFQFLENYKDMERKISDLTTKINEKLKDFHSYNQKLKKVRESYRVEPEPAVDEIRELYNEVLVTFGDLVSKTLEEITAFKKSIRENRNRYLVSKERQLEKVVDELLREISLLETERSRLYKNLDEKGALESISNTYEQLIAEKTDLERNLQTLKQVDDLQEMLGDIDIAITHVKKDINADLRGYESRQDELRRLFLEILDNAIFLGEDYENAYFDISTKPGRSRLKDLPVALEVEVPKADALGHSRLKLVAYDLMVFLSNIRGERGLPDFLIHDGVFHGVSTPTVVNTLNYIFHQQLKAPGFQYIVTFNEDEISMPGDVTGRQAFDFDWKEQVVASYEDTDTEMIFKREFR